MDWQQGAQWWSGHENSQRPVFWPLVPCGCLG